MSAKGYALQNYELLKQFVANQIDALQFQEKFFELHGGLNEETDDELCNILEKGLFFYVDAYWHECTPETETDFEISEPTLRKHAHQLLRDLTRYLEARDLLPDKDPDSE